MEVKDEHRKLVKGLYAVGLDERDVLLLLSDTWGYEVNTAWLHKTFADEIATGHAKANYEVSKALFELATVGKNLEAIKIWLKRQDLQRLYKHHRG